MVTAAPTRLARLEVSVRGVRASHKAVRKAGGADIELPGWRKEGVCK